MHLRFLLIPPLLLVGALTAASENAPPPPDFSNAFVQLAALGMPALDPNAKWATSQDYESSNYELRQLTQSMKGNGWLLPSTDGKIRFLPMSGLAVIATNPKSKADSSGDTPKRAFGGGSSTTRPPTPIKDPIKDATSLISAIKKLIAKNSENEYSRNNIGTEWGDLLLFAAQLHQTGHPQLANDLALATFDLFPSRDAAVDAAIHQIASADYQKAAEEFFKSGDWTAYHQSLTKLVNRFPRGWSAREAIGIFLPQLEKQASGTKAPAPTLPGIPLAPALAALTTDPFLIHFPNTNSNSYRSYSSDESAYASLHRPATRGEIAQSLLTATLPDPENELNNADPETLRDLALSFWKEHQNASREQLAAVFLREGSRSQSSQAAIMLAASKDPAAHQAFETHILASENALGEYQQLQIYLRSRKAAAKPFFAAYAKLVRSQNTAAPDDENGYDQATYMIKQACGMEKILKQLEALVGDQSPRSLAVQIAKGNPEDAGAAIRTLSSLLIDASSTKHLFILLEGANAATDPTVRARFLSATQRINWRSKDNKEDSPPSDRKISEPEIKVWQKLIADTREITFELDPYGDSEEKSTVAELAAASLERSVGLDTSWQVMRAEVILSKPTAAILRERAEARLSGKPLPRLRPRSRWSRALLPRQTHHRLPRRAGTSRTRCLVHHQRRRFPIHPQSRWRGRRSLRPSPAAIPDPSGRPLWRSSFTPDQPGVWTLKLIDSRPNAPATPEALITVPAPPEESDDLSPDPAFLNELAQSTGGQSLDPATFPAFLKSHLIKNPPVTRDTGAIWKPSWNSAPIALLIATLLATEWFLRRRQGLV